MPVNRLRHSMLAAALATVLAGPAAFAQQRAPQGLNALSDDRVMTELANRGLDNLLERLFDQNNVPDEKRQGILTLISLRRLSDTESRLTQRERQQLVDTVVRGIEQALPTIQDPRMLLQQASVLIQEGIQLDVNTLEYWGENPRLQATLAPITQTVIRILDRSVETATAELDVVINQIRSADDQYARRYMELDNLRTAAEFTKHMSQYYRALAMDRASTQRQDIASEAIAALSEHDTPDSGVQPVVKNRVAKLLIARGLEGDFEAAKKLFADVVAGNTNPAPDIAQQYEAIYFTAIADLFAGDLDAAEKDLAQIRQWQTANIPEDQGRQGAEAAAAMLEYRITAARAEAATGEQQQTLNNRAITILVDLVRDQPALRGIIYEQLLDRLPASPDLAQLDPLLLRALMQQGEREIYKPDDEPRDPAIIERAIAATNELLSRQGQSGAGVDEIADAMLLRGILLQAQEKQIDAAEAFIQFVEKFKTHENALFGLENAMGLIGPRLAERQSNPKIDDLYTQVLALAVNPPFNRVDLAYQYGRQLQQEGEYLAAADAFAKVADDAPNALFARYFRMISIKAHLDTQRARLAAAEQTALLDQIQQLANQVRLQADQAAITATTAEDRQRYQLLQVQTTLMSADLANRVQNNPQQALQILQGFEQAVAGLPREQQLLGDALFVRVDAYMDLGQNTQATDALVNLLNTREGSEGAQIIYDLLQRLNQDFEQARTDNNRDEMRELASARAQLTGHLVKWAAENGDPNIRDYTYRYRVFDADSQRQAAALVEDPAERRRLLETARERYLQLLTPQSVAEYQKTIQGTDIDPEAPDPIVSLGLAQVAFDLGDYRTAQPLLTRLIADRRLGPPKIMRGDDLVDNEQYWEAMYKLFRSNIELAGSDPQYAKLRDETRQRLAQFYVMQGDSVGGQRWGEAFGQLRKELLPDFKVDQPAMPQ